MSTRLKSLLFLLLMSASPTMHSGCAATASPASYLLRLSTTRPSLLGFSRLRAMKVVLRRAPPIKSAIGTVIITLGVFARLGVGLLGRRPVLVACGCASA